MPPIKAQAKQENAEIHWADETGLYSDCQPGRGYAARGKAPVIALDAKRLIRFMKGLIKDAKRKVYLILDNLRAPPAKPVKKWLEGYAEKIELFYLPAYSPELNPEENLNCDLKAAVHSGAPARSPEKLNAKTLSHMRKLQKLPQRVGSYFQHEKIRYAV